MDIAFSFIFSRRFVDTPQFHVTPRYGSVTRRRGIEENHTVRHREVVRGRERPLLDFWRFGLDLALARALCCGEVGEDRSLLAGVV